MRVAELYVTEGLRAGRAEEAGPGEIIALAGIPEITIGETIADPEDPRPLPVIAVEEPALGDDRSASTPRRSPGQSGSRLTARMVNDRLDQELVGNVAIRVLDTERPDTWEVQGRGELQLAVLVETMRREGFELTVGKPQVVTREVDGELHEPIERLVDRRRPRTSSAWSRRCWRCARAGWRTWSTTAPAGCGSTSSCPRAG